MRRHAKASTAGSTQRQATGLGRATISVAALLVAMLALSAAPASAAVVTDRPLILSFDGSSSAAGKFSNLSAIEIDQTTGTVYAIDTGKNVLDKFNASGVAQNFSATASSSLSPGFSSGTFNGYSDVAVDNYGLNQGRIYVIKEFGPFKAFSPTGASLWELTGFNDICGLAVDDEGHPWLGDYTNTQVREYANSGAPPTEIGSVNTAPSQPCRLDVDASGNVYVNRYNSGVDKYVGGVKGPTIDAGVNRAVAVDQSSASGHVFTLHSTDFNEYDSTGALIGTFGTGVIDSGWGIAYNVVLDRVYVSDETSDTIKVFGPKATGTVPDPVIQPTTEIGVSKAKFNGKVNPLSLPDASYQFQWKVGTGASWVGAKSSPQAALPATTEEIAVSYNTNALHGNTTYQVRLVGINDENGLRTYSSANTFTTSTAAVAPAVTINPASAIGTTTATVSGTVNPNGDTADWRVQKSTSPTCTSGFTNEALESLAESSEAPVNVSFNLSGLLPSQHYCVRISTTNSFGTVTSETKEFSTVPVLLTKVAIAPAAPRLDTSARLNARVNPQGANSTYPLSYRFEYSKDGGASWIPLATEEDTSEARTPIMIGSELTGLSPNTTYRYRLGLLENDAGPAASLGGEEIFTTRTSAEVAAPSRGIELVNTPDKGNQNVFSEIEDGSTRPITADGEKALWHVLGGAPGGTSSSGNTFLAKRTAGGWVSRNLIPPVEQQYAAGDLPYFRFKATPDFTTFIFGPGATANTPSSRAIVRLDDSQNQELLATYESEVQGFRSEITKDGSHALVINPDTDQLEDIGSATPELISVMPGGSPSVCGLIRDISFVGPGGSSAGAANSWNPGYLRANSEDASRVYFEVQPDGNCVFGRFGLYVRNRETDETTLIDPGAEGQDSHLIRVTPDGGHAYFATRSKLDPTDGNSGRDVYRWDEGPNESSCLTCVVPNANVTGSVLISDDFSHIYFSSTEQLVPDQGQAGVGNTYVLSDGEVRFVGGSAVGTLQAPFAFLSADGNVLIFRTYAISSGQQALTADALADKCIDSDGSGTLPCDQFYRYDDRDGSLECISCRHDGETTFNAGSPSSQGTVSDFRLSADGSTIVFVTRQALVPEDVNQNTDVYEWRNGAVRLITDGVRSFAIGFAAPAVRAVDEDGSDIFFIVAARGLTGFEEDGLSNLYDARIGGGFEPPPPPTHCDGDSCQGPLQAPPPQAQPGSASFSGRGNVAQSRRSCAKGKVRRKGRCVRRHKQKRSQKRASHTKQGRTK